MANHNELGTRGETIAKEHLVSNGYQIIATNYRHSHCEIDIIARTSNTIVFVEVKTRTSSPFASPTDAVTPAKIRHLVEAADHFMQQQTEDLDFRFDVISIVVTKSSHTLNHITDAFLPPLQ